MKKVLVDVSREMIVYCQSEEAREKPYNICLQCPYMPDSCDGPNVLAMDYRRWGEWAKGRLEQMGLSKSGLSERSGVPLSTVTGVLSGSGYDIRTDTMRRITKVLVGGSWGTYPCHFAALLMDGVELEDEVEAKKTADLEREIEALQEEIQEVRREAQAKIDYLFQQVNIRDKYLEEKNKTIDRLVNRILDEK